MKVRQWITAGLPPVLGLWLGVVIVNFRHSSGTDLQFLIALLIVFVAPIVSLVLAATGRWKILFQLMLAPPLFAFLGVQLFSLVYLPSDIRVGFDYPPGASGSYHVAQFHHRVGEEWIEGPKVEGWPMSVSFPDLNSDGYKDIRVVETRNGHSGDSIEFVFIPDGKDGRFWKPHRMKSRLSATYKPAHLYYNLGG